VLLLNLVLDTLVSAYMQYQEKNDKTWAREKVKGILRAFRELCSSQEKDDGELEKDVFHKFTRELSRSPIIKDISEDTADIMFATVDENGGGSVSKKEFVSICGVLEYEFWTTRRDSCLKRCSPLIWDSDAAVWFRQRVYDEDFSTFMNYVLMVNLMLVIVETIYDLQKWPQTAFMENVEFFFSFVYVTEIFLVMTVYSFSYYWSFQSNQFDFATTWLLLLSSYLDAVASSSKGGGIKRYMNILRLLRLLRIVKQLKRLEKVQFMVATISSIISSSKDILCLLGVVIYFYASLSVQLWGGVLYESNPKLLESEYHEKRLYVLNFNDFLMSFGVYVVTLLCEYIAVFPQAVSLASDIPGSWLIFVVFYLSGVAIVFELVKAFTIEVFLDLKENYTQNAEELPTLKELKNSLAEQGQALHYRVVGDLNAQKKVEEAYKEVEESKSK